MNVDGLNSLWDNSGTLTVGGLGAGTLNITNRGVVENTDGFIGNAALGPISGTGTVNVTGAGSQWNNSLDLVVGGAGTGTLNIASEGVVRSARGFVGGNQSSVTVNGEGSRWENSLHMEIGSPVGTTLNVTGGGQLSSDTSGNSFFDVIAASAGFTGSVAVDGSDSRWDSSNFIDVGW